MLSRKWWKRLIITFVVTLTLSIGGTLYEWHSTRSDGEKLRDAAVAQLDADDPGWRVHDIAAKRNASLPPADQNAADIALSAFAKIPKTFDKWAASEETQQQATLSPQVLWSTGYARKAADVIAECAEALAIARTLRHFSHGGTRLEFKEPNPLDTSLQRTQDLRKVGALLQLDAAMHAYSRNPDAALRSAHAILNCGRGAVGDEPTLISQLVRMALTMLAKQATERALGWGESGEAELATLQQAFAEDIRTPRLVYALRGDRAAFYRFLENLDSGQVTLEELGGVKADLGSRLSQRFYKKHLPAQQARFIELFNRSLEADKLTAPDQDRLFDTDRDFPKDYEYTLVRLLFPAVTKVYAAECRTRAQLGAAATALACERYRRKYGQWPASLAAIPKDLLSQVPSDPYTGKPLIFARLDDGVAVYATGPDLIDDGGEDLTPDGKPGTDVGFRLFNPDQRRREPPPKPVEPNDLPDDR